MAALISLDQNSYSFRPVPSVPIAPASHNPTNQYINFRQGVQQWENEFTI